MADDVTFTVNADATPPGGTVAATDETSSGPHSAGAQMGIAKLAVSANGDSTHIPATAADGLLVEVSNLGSGGLTDAQLRASPVDVDVASALPAGTNNIGDVDVLTLPALPAGNNNIGDVDVATVPAPLSTTGGGTEAAALRVTIANNSTGLVSVDDNGGSLTVDGPLTDAELRATPVPVSGTVTATGGLTDAQLRATPVPVSGTVTANAGTNLNTSALALEAGGNLAAAATSLAIMDDWDETDRAKVNPIAGQAGVQGASGTVTALTQRVVLATDVALPAGTNAIGKLAANSGVDIGDVDVTSLPAITGTVTANQGTAGTAWEVVGDVAQDAAIAGNPLPAGGRASSALPTAMSADGDSVYQWLTRSGAAMQALLPHLGTFAADPYTLTAVTAQYTTAQTSTVLINPGASQRIAVTYIQIQVGGTVGGTLQVYFGTGAYSRGTSLAIFDGEFLPSATLKPGFTASPAKPFVSAAADDDLRVTNTGTINPLTVTVWYYLIG